MISYEQVKSSVNPAPYEDLVSLYNDIDKLLTNHDLCINEVNPFSKLYKKDHFCISATSIQSKYIAFVLGKHHSSDFPHEVMLSLFNIENKYNLQYGEIPGKQIDGCLFVYHRETNALDLQTIYDHIYEL